jgi:hypothetical protein
MRTFILRSGLFFFLLVLLFVAIQLQPRRFPPNDFLYGVALKHHLADRIQKPKIILVGGSGVAFGFDSREIQDSLGMPVINMGMHIQLGLDFMLNETKAVMKPNDIVFLSPEYMMSMKGRWEAKSAASRFYPPSKAYYPWDPIANLGFILEVNRRKFKEALAKVVFSTNNSVYCRDAFDTTNGDVIAHLDSPHYSTLAGSALKYEYWPGIRAINHFAEYAQNRNVKVYFLFPDYAASFFQKNRHIIGQYESDVNKDLKIPVLNTPIDFEYPDSIFYDTEYHLLRAGRKMRTDRFIQLAKSNPAVQPYLPASVVAAQ